MIWSSRSIASSGQCLRAGSIEIGTQPPEGAVDPATGFQLGDIEPIEHAGKVNALITLNLRGKRSKTDAADSDPNMPDALEQALT